MGIGYVFHGYMIEYEYTTHNHLYNPIYGNQRVMHPRTVERFEQRSGI